MKTIRHYRPFSRENGDWPGRGRGGKETLLFNVVPQPGLLSVHRIECVFLQAVEQPYVLECCSGNSSKRFPWRMGYVTNLERRCILSQPGLLRQSLFALPHSCCCKARCTYPFSPVQSLSLLYLWPPLFNHAHSPMMVCFPLGLCLW